MKPWQYRPAGSAIVKSDKQAPYPRVCAHRGFPAIAPENSMPAYGAAVALGVDEIEFDLWPTKDGEIVSIHDDTLDRVSTKRVEAEEENGEKLEFRNVLPIILCSAVVSGVSYMLQLIGAANLPATVLYPIVSGGSIIFSTITGMLCFKERPNLYQKIGVVLCFVGTCLFL